MQRKQSQEDYLEAIFVISQEKSQVRSIDIANYLNYSKPSISHAMGLLVKEGLIEFDEEKHIHFTERGRDLAYKVYEKHQFFKNILEKSGVDKETAAEEACQLEHAISNESFDKIKKVFSERENE